MKTFQFDKTKHGVNLQMELGIIEETPGFFFSPETHCTDFYEIMIFRQGNGHIILDTQKIELQDNDFLFITPFQKRQWFVDRDNVKGYFLIFEKDFLSDFFADQLFVYRLQYFYNHGVKPILSPDRRLFSFQHDIFDEILHEIKHFKKDSPHLLRSILYYILIKLNRVYCAQHNLEPDTQINNLAYQFKAALEQNIREKQQVNEYAQLLGISRISLNNAVKKQFGRNVTELIKERLLVEIKSELLYSQLSIAEIAYQLNFSESNNLIRFFKSKTGTTPKTFRTTYQNDHSFS